jgi:hypothetical protein
LRRLKTCRTTVHRPPATHFPSIAETVSRCFGLRVDRPPDDDPDDFSASRQFDEIATKLPAPELHETSSRMPFRIGSEADDGLLHHLRHSSLRGRTCAARNDVLRRLADVVAHRGNHRCDPLPQMRMQISDCGRELTTMRTYEAQRSRLASLFRQQYGQPSCPDIVMDVEP